MRKVWQTDPPGREGDVILRGMLRVMEEDELACPASAAPVSCAWGMAAAAESRRTKRDRFSASLALELVTPLVVPRDSELERDLQDYFCMGAQFRWGYVKVLLEAPIRVAALRLHVEQRRTGRCPTQTDQLAKGLELRPGRRGLEIFPPSSLPKEMFSRGTEKALVTLDCGAAP